MFTKTVGLLIRALIIGILINVGLQLMPAQPSVATHSPVLGQPVPLIRAAVPSQNSFAGQVSTKTP